MIKRMGIVLLAVILVSLFSGCTEMSADQIAQKMKEKQGTIKDFSATMVMSSSLMGNDINLKAKMLNKLPGKSRIEYLEPAEMAGQVMVNDGNTIWSYDPRTNEVTKMDLPENDKSFEMDYMFIKELLNQTDISYQTTEKFEGRNVYIIKASPKNAGMMMGGRYNMFVDSETWMPLKIDMLDKDDKLIISIEYREIKFNTGIPDSEFEFKIPAGTKVIAQDPITLPKELTLEEARNQADFTILSPSYLPAGYSFKSATVMKFDRIEMVTLLYMDGTKRLSITEKIKENTPAVDMDGVEKVSINGAEGKLISLPIGGNMLTWSSAKLDFMMSSELSREDAIKVAESMK